MPESESPETTISSERVYEGKRISVRLEHVRLIDGTESTRDIVDHPNAVVVLAVDDDSNILFVRQYRKAPEVELLELPAGVMDTGETDPAKSAQRELREETGHAAGSLIQLGSFYSAPGTMTDDERIALERMSFAQAVVAARAGVFQDSKTLASLFLAAPYFPRI